MITGIGTLSVNKNYHKAVSSCHPSNFATSILRKSRTKSCQWSELNLCMPVTTVACYYFVSGLSQDCSHSYFQAWIIWLCSMQVTPSNLGYIHILKIAVRTHFHAWHGSKSMLLFYLLVEKFLGHYFQIRPLHHQTAQFK